MNCSDIINKIQNYMTKNEYDGAVPYEGDYIPYKYLEAETVIEIHDKWMNDDTEINKGMSDIIEIWDKIVNPRKLYISRDWVPIAQFNGGSHLFAVIQTGAHAGKVIGIFQGPYAVVTLADSIEVFNANGIKWLKKMG